MGASEGIAFLVGKAIEKLHQRLFARQLGSGLGFEVGAREYDPERFRSTLDFPCPNGWAATRACDHEVFLGSGPS